MSGSRSKWVRPWNARCSERIVAAIDRLLQSGLGHLRRKPRNRIRHWKMRKTLRYYRLF